MRPHTPRKSRSLLNTSVPMEDVVSELLRPLDERDRMRGERMARTAKQGPSAVRQRRLAPKLVRRRCRRRRSTQKPAGGVSAAAALTSRHETTHPFDKPPFAARFCARARLRSRAFIGACQFCPPGLPCALHGHESASRHEAGCAGWLRTPRARALCLYRLRRTGAWRRRTRRST